MSVHKCFISFKHEDEAYRDRVQEHEGAEYIDKSLDTLIESDDPDYILQVIRQDYLSDSTVTIHLIGKYSAESAGPVEQQFIKRELQASLWNGEGNTKSGIVGVVLPSMIDAVYRGSYSCTTCGGSHSHVALNDDTVVTEFSYNYYIPNGRCSHADEDRYCVLVRWEDFIAEPSTYIQQAFDKRSAPIADKTKVRP